jgi:hypothetical protein
MIAIAHLKDRTTGQIIDAAPFDVPYQATQVKMIRDAKSLFGFGGIKSKAIKDGECLRLLIHGRKVYIEIYTNDHETEF